jgi:hypothetical protein
VLLVGDSTGVGRAIWEELNHTEDMAIAHCGCQHNIDWSSSDAPLLLQYINITKAIVACPPVYPRFCETNGASWVNRLHSTYLKGFGKLMRSKKIPWVYVVPGPIETEHEDLVKEGAGQLILTPNLASDDSILARAVRECAVSGASTVELRKNERITGLTPYDVARIVIPKLKKPIPGSKFRIDVQTDYDLKTAIEKATPGCDLKIKPFQHIGQYSTQKMEKIKHQVSEDQFRQFAARKFEAKNKSDVYLSIVVVGRHDNFSNGFESRTQNFLDYLGIAMERIPLARIELLFVDYATPDDQTPLHETFTLPKQLIGKTRFLRIPVSRHVALQQKLKSNLAFFEYIVKNVGIRRARGQFILSTNPDNLFPSTLFELIADEDLNEGVLYRSIRWDTRDHTFDNLTVAELWQSMGEPWRILQYDVKQRCSEGENRFTVNDGVKKFLDQAWPCGGGDFLLASKNIWDTVWGFHEVPANPNVDAVFLAKFMKLLPGYARFFIHPLNMHQRHAKKIVFRPAVNDLDQVMEELACWGESKTLGKGWDSFHWGLEGEIFEEIEI